jgi:DNA-binding NarL/FixJ family response regulator
VENPGKRPRVVIAEDFILIQESIRIVLEEDCDVVATAENGEDALDAIAAHEPDIVTLDVSFPDGMSGFAVVERLNQAHSATNVIFVTAYRDKTYVEKAFEMGAKGYVLKGCIGRELPAAVRAVMGGGRYRSPLLP